MKILRVISSLNPAYGGPVEGLIKSSVAMRAMGHLNEVVTLDSPQDTWIPGFPIRVHALGPTGNRYCYTPKLVPWLRTNASRYDAVIVHGLWTFASLGAWWALASSQRPYVIFTHGMMDPWFRRANPIKHALKQLYWLALEGRVLSNAKYVLFTSEEERQHARQTFFGHAYQERVVAYGTADVSGSAEDQINAFRQHLPSLGERKYFLFLSRVHAKKGCDLLIKAFAPIADQYPDLDLVIAGPCTPIWREKLELIARSLKLSSRIHWPGMLSGEIKWGAFRGSEAFVLPSHQENFGIVVAEAMACSKPVLITNKVNIWREVSSHRAGLVGNDDVEGVTEILTQFSTLSTLDRSAMGANGRQLFLKRFNVEQAAKDLLNVVAEMAI